MKKQRMIINVRGGVVQDVFFDGDLEVTIVDWDVELPSPNESEVFEARDDIGRRVFAWVGHSYPLSKLSTLSREMREVLSGPQV